jgi:ribosomal protein S18 acetylase RimI-like enzyme
MNIDRLLPQHASAYRALMLEAYAAHPEAFTSSASERAALPLSWWEARLSDDRLPAEVVFGASEGSALLGVVGLSFEKREKTRHKATLFGIYVPNACRGQGLGRTLLTTALAYARSRHAVRIVQLTVTEGNQPAETLYRQSGFVPFGIEPFAVALGSEYLAKVHMWCDLKAQPSATGQGKIPPER